MKINLLTLFIVTSLLVSCSSTKYSEPAKVGLDSQGRTVWSRNTDGTVTVYVRNIRGDVVKTYTKHLDDLLNIESRDQICSRFKDRLGCTATDALVMSNRNNPAKTAQGLTYRTAGHHGRALGGYLRTTDFKPQNKFELEMYRSALSCIKKKSGSFDESFNDLIVVETAGGEIDRTLLAPKYAGNGIDIIKGLLAQSVKEMKVTVVDTKGTYGIHHGQVYNESQRIQTESSAIMYDMKIFSCPEQICLETHFNSTCRTSLSYTVATFPKSVIKTSMPVVLDQEVKE